jgi:hypothetical protein
MASNTTSNSDTPALPAVRVPQANENSMDAAMAEPAGLVAPLPSLRTPARANTQEDVAPLPTIRSARAASPDPFDPEEENAIVHTEIRKSAYNTPLYCQLTYNDSVRPANRWRCRY